MLYQSGAHNGSNMGYRMHSYPIYQDYQARAEPLAQVICRRLMPASLNIGTLPDLLALLLCEAVRRLAVLPRLLEREPVFRAMVRYSMRWGRAIGRFEIRDYFTRACSAREHEC